MRQRRLDEAAVASGGGPADAAALEQHDARRRVAALGEQGRPEPRVAAADDREIGVHRSGERRLRGHAEDVTAGMYIRVRVRDTGVGMERCTVDRIFEPFFTTKEKGTGMGLAAVYGTVRSHRGLIQVDTERGAGTTFEIMFPLRDDIEEETAESYRLHQPSAAAHVLVVDDEEIVCQLAADMIRAKLKRIDQEINEYLPSLARRCGVPEN